MILEQESSEGAKIMIYLVYMSFIFLFVVVLMNFLNAIAIGDIQELRENAIAETNRRKIENLLDQVPDVPHAYVFEGVNRPSQFRNGQSRIFATKVIPCQNILHFQLPVYSFTTSL